MQNIIITGAGRRIGKGLAERFAKHGWNVAIIYNTSQTQALSTADQLRHLHGVQCEAFQADVRNQEDIAKAFSDIQETFGECQALVNNAGVFPRRTSLVDIDEALVDDTLAVNFKAALFCSQAFTKFCEKGNARIINIASLGGLETWKERIPYNASKAALLQLTRNLARDLAPNVAVNSVSPGTIAIPEEPAIEMMISAERIPMGRHGSVDDIFAAVHFFTTAPLFITGQNITVDGGYHCSRT